ncbi:tetratricopeptide repeat protein [Oceanispirochaeta crateris]|uniref:Tetratricopeptide repeat protein n=2 Tax=Oceanispirochaeta crateris TaxID=2518645 RepID=A0A5C1QK65_9SPIO|nr:tetratricopeptide repeat protein [Oceanispirochaeta crateris]
MERNALRFKLLVFSLFMAMQATASAAPLEDEFLYALDLFREARYEQSSRLFQTILDDPDSLEIHGESEYWLFRCYFENNDLTEATEILEDFLIQYPSHKYNTDARYYKGRILFLQEEYENTIHFYSSFLTTFPLSSYGSNSLFWIGESLYYLGRFEEAEEIYNNLLKNYPRSVKVEAARYRLSLIEYCYREEELLKLLQWSHEEFLKSSSEYELKEKEFNQALSVYQEKLIELTKTRELYENRLNLLQLKESLLQLKETLMKDNNGGDQND